MEDGDSSLDEFEDLEEDGQCRDQMRRVVHEVYNPCQILKRGKPIGDGGGDRHRARPNTSEPYSVFVEHKSRLRIKRRLYTNKTVLVFYQNKDRRPMLWVPLYGSKPKIFLFPNPGF